MREADFEPRQIAAGQLLDLFIEELTQPFVVGVLSDEFVLELFRGDAGEQRREFGVIFFLQERSHLVEFFGVGGHLAEQCGEHPDDVLVVFHQSLDGYEISVSVLVGQLVRQPDVGFVEDGIDCLPVDIREFVHADVDLQERDFELRTFVTDCYIVGTDLREIVLRVDAGRCAGGAQNQSV